MLIEWLILGITGLSLVLFILVDFDRICAKLNPNKHKKRSALKNFQKLKSKFIDSVDLHNADKCTSLLDGSSIAQILSDDISEWKFEFKIEDDEIFQQLPDLISSLMMQIQYAVKPRRIRGGGIDSKLYEDAIATILKFLDEIEDKLK